MFEELKSLDEYDTITLIDLIIELDRTRQKVNEIIKYLNNNTGDHIPRID